MSSSDDDVYSAGWDSDGDDGYERDVQSAGEGEGEYDDHVNEQFFDDCEDAYDQGYDDGYEDGFEDGWEEGSRPGLDDADAFDATAGDSKAESTDHRGGDSPDDRSDDECYPSQAQYIYSVNAAIPQASATATTSSTSSSAFTRSSYSSTSTQQPLRYNYQTVLSTRQAPATPYVSSRAQLPAYTGNPAYAIRRVPMVPYPYPYLAPQDPPLTTLTAPNLHKQQILSGHAYDPKPSSSIPSTRISVSRSQYENLSSQVQRLELEVQELRRQQQQSTPSQVQRPAQKKPSQLQSAKQRDKQAQRCFLCHRAGHLARNCLNDQAHRQDRA